MCGPVSINYKFSKNSFFQNFRSLSNCTLLCHLSYTITILEPVAGSLGPGELRGKKVSEAKESENQN